LQSPFKWILRSVFYRYGPKTHLLSFYKKPSPFFLLILNVLTFFLLLISNGSLISVLLLTLPLSIININWSIEHKLIVYYDHSSFHYVELSYIKWIPYVMFPLYNDSLIFILIYILCFSLVRSRYLSNSLYFIIQQSTLSSLYNNLHPHCKYQNI